MQVSQTPRIHPLIAAAAASIILVCMLGVAVLAYTLPLKKDGSSSGLASLFSRQAVPATPVVQVPVGAAVPVALGTAGSVVVSVAPVGSASVPGAVAVQPTAAPSTAVAASALSVEPPATANGSAPEAVTAGTALPAPAAKPAFETPKTLAAAPAPPDAGAPVSSALRTEREPAVVQKSKGLSAAQLAAARRATAALANGRTPDFEADGAPAKMRPEQLEEARRATALLAQAAQGTPAGIERAAATAAPTRMSGAQSQAAQELEASRSRTSGTPADPAPAPLNR